MNNIGEMASFPTKFTVREPTPQILKHTPPYEVLETSHNFKNQANRMRKCKLGEVVKLTSTKPSIVLYRDILSVC